MNPFQDNNIEDRILRVFCDVKPLKNSLASLCDHSGWRIYSLCSLPMFTMTDSNFDPVPLTVLEQESSKDHCFYRFQIRSDLFWNDGSQITGFDYKRGIEHLCSDPSHRFRSIFLDVDGYKELSSGSEKSLRGLKAGKDWVSFQLRNANILFPMLLTFPGASPRHAKHPELMPGAYTVTEVSHQSLKLRLQEPFFGHTKQANIIEFDFSLPQSDPYGLERWRAGKVHETWDCYFPYEKTADFESLPEFNQSNPGIYVTLKPQLCGQKISAGIIKKLNMILDRDAICHHLCSDVRSFYGFSSDKKYTLNDLETTRETLIIAWEDFIPNKDLVKCIQKQAKKSGIDVELRKVNYGEHCKDAHLKLTLIHQSFPDPLLFYRGELTDPSFCDRSSSIWLNYAKIFTQYQRSGREIRKDQGRVMDIILQEQGRFIPIVSLPGYLLRSQLIEKNEYSPGKPWRWA